MDPSYATLVLGYLENELYSQVFNTMGEEIGHYVYNQSYCYINWPGEDKVRDNDRSTGRSNYNRRPFLGQGLR